jgi:hypothetical protein
LNTVFEQGLILGLDFNLEKMEITFDFQKFFVLGMELQNDVF